MTDSAPPLNLELVKLRCPACLMTGVPIIQRSENGLAMGAYCSAPACKQFIMWVPQREQWHLLERQQLNDKPGNWTGLSPYAAEPAAYGTTVEVIALLVYECDAIARDHGWLANGSRSALECCMLVVTEMAELAEAFRNGTENDPSEHIPEFTQQEEEWADLFIRGFNHSCELGVKPRRLGEAILAKMEFNRSRPYRHGGKRA